MAEDDGEAGGGDASTQDPPPLTPPPQAGRRQTRPTLGMEPPGWRGERAAFDGTAAAAAAAAGRNHSAPFRRLLQSGGRGVAQSLGARTLWDRGFHGEGVRMGVFDTGVRADHPHFKRIRERTNWTAEKSLDDGLGHGTFVAGVIMGTDPACPGFAPEAELYTFRVFTNAQLSYTSWFLDAFNYAIARKMHVINLSIGGPDYLDAPFVEKIWEVTGNGIVMVSAIGNDGPLWGTLNNPADQMDVLGVGGIGFDDEIAGFSSRGMTTGELPRGMGRFKPDVVAPGRDVLGSKIQGGCRPLSGTSVASPVAAGAVVLLASTVPHGERRLKVTPGSMKQAMIEGAKRLKGPNVFEQGAGKIDLLRSAEILKAYKPRASAVPASLVLDDCGDKYMWPFCAQPLYFGAQPLVVNVTLLNGMGVTGWLAGPPVFKPARRGDGKHLAVSFTHSERLWPWSGFLGVFVRVKRSGAGASGVAEGTITLTVVTPPSASRDPTAAAKLAGADGLMRSEVTIPLRVRLAAPPPRHMRVLWSVWHNVPYPPAYIPRDNLDMKQDILDWHGDHPATNFHAAYDALRAAGYFVEMLTSPLTCFDAEQYGALLLIDAEEEYAPAEITKLEADVKERGLSVIVFGEWYHVPTMVSMRFFDDNTHSYWTPPVGGANVPALNELLAPFGAAFGDRVLKGSVTVGSHNSPFASGANIARLPAGATAHVARLNDATGSNAGWGDAVSGVSGGGQGAAFLGLIQAEGEASKAGRVVLFGDSNCLDSSHATGGDCFWLLPPLLRYATEGKKEGDLFPASGLLSKPLETPEPLPQRRSDTDFTSASKVMGGKRLVCGAGEKGDLGSGDEAEASEAEAKQSLPAAADADAAPADAEAAPPAPGGGTPPAAEKPVAVGAAKSLPPPRRPPPPPSPPRGVDAFATSRGAATGGYGAGAAAAFATPEMLHWAPMILGPAGLGVLAFWLRGTRRRSREREAAAAALPRLRFNASPGLRSQAD